MDNSPLPIVRSVADLRRAVAGFRAQGASVALVPTMGALHAGHIALVHEARRRAARVVVSIFVNPTQFGPNEDLSRYPRQEAADAALLAEAHADLVFAPTVAEMYPPGAETIVRVDHVSQGLCGTFRPGHFQGVATIVTKLLLQALPDFALFGEKDFQQLKVIQALARDLNIPVQILGVPTVREADGLALSSRNAYLSAEQRARAVALPTALKAACARLARGEPAEAVLGDTVAALTQAGFDPVQYVEVRDAATLDPVERVTAPARVLAAAYLGTTRLIDNWPVEPGRDGTT
ncbi:pantoate--beta-alanine ligase [Zavarzinia sp. CC-PAN008]|uniref:pantoate--beta-alanine ligase n=1 Tax=Zavarzinia sp. CC-PAN008 TaxID=3243332 RepID=UPI003F749406